MRLIIHAGLHKTGSTYLQHLMNDNHERLAACGVYYEKQPGYPAHHFAAWDILRGDSSPVGRMVNDARQAGCHTTILSSEDLEGAIFDVGAAQAIEEAATAAGVESIEWHLCLRDAGESFSSLYAQLQHHVYADAAAMLFEVLRDGMIMILDPVRGQPGTPFWCYCFDHLRYIGAFAEQTRHPVFAHDFRDSRPFPGWGVLERAGGLGAISTLPGDEARNSRMSQAAVRDGYCDHFAKLLESEQERQLVMPLIKEHVRRSSASVDRYAEVVRQRFAAGTAATLEAFAHVPEAEAVGAPRRACA